MEPRVRVLLNMIYDATSGSPLKITISASFAYTYAKLRGGVPPVTPCPRSPRAPGMAGTEGRTVFSGIREHDIHVFDYEHAGRATAHIALMI